uniref:Uncharacterized protein n=1 Tax=Anguilla anguilla TaxID=7936 RepID=A0A0E9TFN4_ANGAN
MEILFGIAVLAVLPRDMNSHSKILNGQNKLTTI